MELAEAKRKKQADEERLYQERLAEEQKQRVAEEREYRARIQREVKERDEQDRLAKIREQEEQRRPPEQVSIYRTILNQLKNSEISPGLYLEGQDPVKRYSLGNRQLTPKYAASIARVMGRGRANNYVPLTGYPRNQPDYMRWKQDRWLKIGELFLTARWPPQYRGPDDRTEELAMAFWVTELAVVSSNLPDFRFSEWTESDRENVRAVLDLFGEVLIFENLPYEISGWDALRRLGN